MATRIPLIDPEHFQGAAIHVDRACGCGACIGACAPSVLAFERRGWRKVTVLEAEEPCTGCAKCQVRCWTHAIRMVLPATASPVTAVAN